MIYYGSYLKEIKLVKSQATNQIDKIETERQLKAGKRKITDIASLEKGKNSIKKAHINTQIQIENIEDVVYELVGYGFNQETSPENIKGANEISSEDSSKNIKQKTSPFITIKQNYMKIPFHAYSEPLLISLLASSSNENRTFAVNMILKVRGNSEQGDEV